MCGGLGMLSHTFFTLAFPNPLNHFKRKILNLQRDKANNIWLSQSLTCLR